MIQIDLPYPPSVNTYWRHPTKGPLAGRHLISDAGRKYRAAVEAIVRPMRLAMDDRLCVVIECYPPDRRKRDLDNIAKGLLDAMTHAGAWLDDEQIDDLRIIRREVVKGGMVKISFKALEADQTPRKYTIEDLKAITAHYRAKVRELKRAAE